MNIADKTLNYVKSITAQSISKAGSGHTGAALGVSAIMLALFKDHYNFDVSDTDFLNRDRFILSAGHACPVYYTLLSLFGFDLSLQDLKNLRVISLKSKDWDKGVLGIVCSRLVEKYHKPVFLFAEERGILSGSGRSINDINIHQLLSSLQDILETYGGHSMAAGLSLKVENYQQFAEKINAFTLNYVSDDVFIPIKYYDQDIEADEINEDFIKQLSLLEPYGCENPRPKFKITASDIKLEPMRKFPQHCVIKIGNLNLTYFNFVNNINKITFSRQKSFIFEFQPRSLKGIVDQFDGGSFIVEDAYKKLNTIELNQLMIDGKGEAKYTLYPKEELLSFVGLTTTSVFGTCFVTYSCFDYVQFAKDYNTKGIYQFSIYRSICYYLTFKSRWCKFDIKESFL